MASMASMASMTSRSRNLKTKKRKRSPSISTKEPTIFIMWSCDPPPDPTSGEDVIYKKRIEIDAKGLKNASHFWNFIKPKRKPTKKQLGLAEDLGLEKVEEDYTAEFLEPDGSIGKPGFYQFYGTTPKKIGSIEKKYKRDIMTTLKSTQSSKTFNPELFEYTLQNGNIIYLPIHGGNALDFGPPNVSSFIIPKNIFIVTFNPPNTSSGFMCREIEDDFLTFMVNPENLRYISHTSNRKGKFQEEFYKNLRVWGEGDEFINKPTITDRDQDLRIKNPGEKTFKRLSKALLRRVTGLNIKTVIDDVVENFSSGTKKRKPKKKSLKKNSRHHRKRKNKIN
tara:strand:- start:862 stop:1872 length:1011 start_codon:yes stop_codon:yes gene_type:complete